MLWAVCGEAKLSEPRSVCVVSSARFNVRKPCRSKHASRVTCM